MPALPPRRSNCPISCTLDLLGDKWTLLVVRDLVMGKSRFDEFLKGPEGIASNILAKRLKLLTDAGYVTRKPDPSDGRQVLYELTPDGEPLRELAITVARWGEKHFPDAKIPRERISQKSVSPPKQDTPKQSPKSRKGKGK
ncbi:transcriptional regulator [Bremerella cremea]|uniref:Transcriptional regulator n=1 Tax=Blastopirellula marina TaxID=124 RepID=A0A2S8FWH6_9BACT|nr:MULTISPECIES: helix-turn-helix domain-containing protein [Pirellulaceae]PQO36420.1 transcriptional regulator [Blastopirellula marina]RCS49098.1 transcriptional regulator [Bremerella cremea]